MSSTSETVSSGSQADVSDAILSHLLSSHKVEDLHSSLLNSLAAVGWTDRVRKLAFDLLRSREHNHFEDVVDRIVSLATSNDGDGILPGKRKRDGEDSDDKQPNGNGKLKRPRNGTSNDKGGNSVKRENGDERNGIHDDTTAADNDSESGVRIPQQVVNDGVRFLEEAMHDIITTDDEKNTDDDDDAEFDEEYVGEQNNQPETNGSFGGA